MQISRKIKFFAFWSSNNWEMHLFDHFTTPTTIVVVPFSEKVNILFAKTEKATHAMKNSIDNEKSLDCQKWTVKND